MIVPVACGSFGGSLRRASADSRMSALCELAPMQKKTTDAQHARSQLVNNSCGAERVPGKSVRIIA